VANPKSLSFTSAAGNRVSGNTVRDRIGITERDYLRWINDLNEQGYVESDTESFTVSGQPVSFKIEMGMGVEITPTGMTRYEQEQEK
jgi:biotin operon repressor